MRCPICKEKELIEVMAKNGVLIDYCPQCQGIWLDEGEIFFFTKAPKYLRWEIEEALKNPKPSQKLNPHTQEPLVELSLFKGKLLIDYCSKSGGIWLDKGEILSIAKLDSNNPAINRLNNFFSDLLKDTN